MGPDLRNRIHDGRFHIKVGWSSEGIRASLWRLKLERKEADETGRLRVLLMSKSFGPGMSCAYDKLTLNYLPYSNFLDPQSA